MASMTEYITNISISGTETATHTLKHQPSSGTYITVNGKLNGESTSYVFNYGSAASASAGSGTGSYTITYDGDRTFTFATDSTYVGVSITYTGTVIPYVINSDKTKTKIKPKKWVDISILTTQSMIQTGSTLKYTVNVDGSVTIIGSLTINAYSGGEDFATLPSAIQLKGSSLGIGTERDFPIIPTHNGKQVHLRIESGNQLGMILVDSISSTDYLTFEMTYNPTY